MTDKGWASRRRPNATSDLMTDLYESNRHFVRMVRRKGNDASINGGRRMSAREYRAWRRRLDRLYRMGGASR